MAYLVKVEGIPWLINSQSNYHALLGFHDKGCLMDKVNGL